MDKATSRFSRLAFGGGEAGEAAACRALAAHVALLVPGTRVRVYRGNPEGMVGIVEGETEGCCLRVQDEAPNGLAWAIEPRNLEIVAEQAVAS